MTDHEDRPQPARRPLGRPARRRPWRAGGVALAALGALAACAAPPLVGQAGAPAAARGVAPSVAAESAGRPGAAGGAARAATRDDVRALRALLDGAPARARRGALAYAAVAAAAVPRERLAWPLPGAVLAAFGERPNGARSDGIDIAAAGGGAEPVRAAERGTVLYAGSELAGYGSLVLIRHAGGLTTVYANNRSLLVRTGDEVARGQPVGRLAGAGVAGAPAPYLHFQVRAAGRPVDPGRYLARRETMLASAELR